jgi:hypothetical protein
MKSVGVAVGVGVIVGVADGVRFGDGVGGHERIGTGITLTVIGVAGKLSPLTDTVMLYTPGEVGVNMKCEFPADSNFTGNSLQYH